jgi:ATP-dependent protease ClpP protease subunit
VKEIYAAMQKALGFTAETMAAKLAKHRVLIIDGKIDSERSTDICRVLAALELKEVAPITLLISSGGGDVLPANTIGDTIRALHSPVDGLVIGRAASMAVDLLLMCRTRRALPHAEFFVHFIRCNFNIVCDSDKVVGGDITAIKQKMTAGKKARENLYMKRLGKSRREVQDLFRLGEKYDLNYTAREALALGIIDEIDSKFKLFDLPV